MSRELRSARQLVANTLSYLGYEPVWQEIFGTESGDLRSVLRGKINNCKGVVQLIGQCYGAEPAAPDEQLGRVSYTQYEALYARQRGKKVWYLFIDESFRPTRTSRSRPSCASCKRPIAVVCRVMSICFTRSTAVKLSKQMFSNCATIWFGCGVG